MYASMVRANRYKKSIKATSYTKKLYQYELFQYLFTWWWLSWRKNKDTMTLWEAVIFSECWKNMGSIDLEQQQEQKKKQGQWQCLWQQLKADVSGKGETRSQHTQISLPEPQHKPVTGTHLGFILDAALLYSHFCHIIQYGVSNLHLIVYPASA